MRAIAATAAILLIAGCGRSAQRAPASGASPPAPNPLFTDIAPGSPLGKLSLSLPGKRPLNLLQTIGNGAALLDIDSDGNLDVLIASDPPVGFRGDGKGGFAPIDGLPKPGRPIQGIAVGDFDNDGDPDVYLSGYRTAALWRNDSGRFVDCTPGSGLAAEPWGTAAAFADLDRDGRLDLVVANYVRFEPENGTRTLCDFRDTQGNPVLAACGPREYLPLTAKVYRNQGSGRFADATTTSGATSRGRGLGIAIADPDASGNPRVAIANDEAPGDLWVVAPGLRITNIGDRSGTATDRDGKLHGGMGVDWGDADGDGRLDLAVATFEGEPMSVYRNDGSDLFTDVGMDNGTGAATRPFVTFGLRWVDIDNDGHLDLAVTNGHVQDNTSALRAKSTFRQPSQILRNNGKGRFVDIGEPAGAAITDPIVGRGLAAGDIDNDGRIDLLLIDSEGAPRLARNTSVSPGNWIGFQLEGSRSPRDGTGALVAVTAGGRRLVRHAHTDGSYLSASDPRVLVGIGDASAVDSVEIRWPSGTVQTLVKPASGQYHRVREPARGR